MIKVTQNFVFTPFEKSTIKELIKYSVGKNIESARIIKNNKDITDKFIIKELEDKIFVFAKGEILPCHKSRCPIFDMAKKRILLKDTTYIHYHPLPLPLSFGDGLNAVRYKLEKMIAVFKDGRHSIFLPNRRIKLSEKPFIDGNQTIKEIANPEHENYILKNKANTNKYKAYIEAFWQKFAKDTNSKYFSTM